MNVLYVVLPRLAQVWIVSPALWLTQMHDDELRRPL